MQYIKNGDLIYVSTGEDFDIMTYYDEYKILESLGGGGFGNVSLGQHKKTGEKVAIKITNSDAIDTAKDVYMVFAEAETLKNLKHPNIVTMYNCFLD
jgi:serine/threonine protein kinase